MLSVIIPSFKDPLLPKTVKSLLDNAEGDIEIIVVFDGYWPEEILWNDKRVKILHLGKNKGMRDAINAGVAMSRGEFLMRTDEHCIFGRGYDVIITKDLQDNEIHVPRRFFLDTKKWKVMDLPFIDYEKLYIDRERMKFAGIKWPERTKERLGILIDETMAMQGSCWAMKRSWWDKVVVRLESEGYGTHYQDSIEMVMKTWQAGGRLMINKNTWYAHKHRDFPRTHNYPGDLAKASFDHSLSVWGEYYQNIIVPKWKI